jgi:hypothetical protein
VLDLGPNHVVFGSRLRWQRGSVPLRLDEAWRSDMHRATRAWVTALTFPLLRRYGYALNPPPSAEVGSAVPGRR